MRALPAGLQDHLSSGVTTLCRCWRMERTDGLVQGFTDHDRALSFDGVTYSATEGLASTGDVTKAGFAVGGLEIAGALTSAGLDAGDLRDGRYDGAAVELRLVNWAAPEERVLMRRGTLGEVTREDGAFRAEVRGPMQALETVRGRVFAPGCDADLGDARCGVDLAALEANATVVSADGEAKPQWSEPLLASLPSARRSRPERRGIGRGWAEGVRALAEKATGKGRLVSVIFFFPDL